MNDITREQLNALIEFISAEADRVVHQSVGLAGEIDSWDEKINLFKAFGFNYFEDSE